MFEDRLLCSTFESKRDKMAEGWRKFHDEELRNLYYVPYTIIRVIRSRRMTVWLRHVERVEPMRNA
jgi:hypothetical protein